MGSIWPKYMMFELKRYRGVIFHDAEEQCKIWSRTDFGKWQEEYDRFSTEHSKVSLGLWWDPFIQGKKCMSLKLAEELCVTTMKYDAKFQEELTYCFKNWHKKFDEFWPEHLEVSTIAL